MSFWKILGGIAAGVGVVVALPIAGPIGAVTAIGAAIGGTLGGAAGAVVAFSDEEEVNSAHKAGERTATAKYEEEVKNLKAALTEALNRLKDDKAFFQLLIALFAIGMATANADGEIAEVELADLEMFTGGIANSNLPPHVKETIADLKKNPPNFNSAMVYVKKLENPDMKLFEQVISLISMSDGRVTEEELAFLEAFKKAAA
jgi:NADH:ubiquinone oxidoreductase subunit C